APAYDRALGHYEAFLQQHPSHPSRPAALRRLGGLQKDVFRDYDRAEALFREVLAHFPDGDVAARARLDLGAAALMRGNLAEARAAFAQVGASARIGQAAEEARLELGRLAFYEGSFETAKTRTRAMKRNTATDVANDAIALNLLLSEHAGPDSSALRVYARARLLQRQQRPAPALAVVDSLLTRYPSHSLADDAHFLRAEL